MAEEEPALFLDETVDEVVVQLPQKPSSQSSDVVEKASRARDLAELVPRDEAGELHSLPYVAHIVRDLLETDMLVVLGKGLDMELVFESFLNTVGQCGGLILILGGLPSGKVTTTPPIVELASSSAPASKRERYYSQGGFYSLSSPIFVVDVLTGVLDLTQVTGVIILNAEQVSDNSGVAFAVRLLKQKSPQAFIKALSSEPERVSSGFSGLTNRLRVLGVKSVGLWPRFHVLVDRSLPKLEVEEIIVEQDPIVKRMQSEIAECMQACLSDIKRRVPHLDLYFIEEHKTAASSANEIKNPNIAKPRSQETPGQDMVVASLDRLLSIPNLHIRIRNSLKSIWHKLSWPGKQSVHALSTLQDLLDCLVRYDAVTFFQTLVMARRDVTQPWVTLPAADALLNDAKSRLKPQNRRPSPKWEHLADLVDSLKNSRVLIMCSTRKTMHELHDYLQLRDHYFDQLFSGTNSDDRDEEKEIKKEDAEKDDAAQPTATRIRSSVPDRGSRRRVRGGSSAAKRSSPMEDESYLHDIPDPDAVLDEHILEKEPVEFETMDIPTASTTINIATYNSKSGFELLHEFEPDAIVMYDPQLEFTRNVEVWSALGGQSEVYFMYYHESVEEMQYLHNMRHEKDAFSNLIREKAVMPMVIDDAPETDESEIRVVGNRRSYAVQVGKPKVVVDSREFRSALPFLLWKNGMEIVPLTLLVGDYVLTPEIVVERKSLPDLVNSFRDGRLFTQCENMFRHYKTVVLLIEFDNGLAFSLDPFVEIRAKKTSATHREIQQNIVTLLLAFPELRIVWSASPQHTAEIFRSLKSHEKEPEASECAEAGQRVLLDTIALDVLESMPGVDRRNSHLLAQKAATLTDLVKLRLDDLVPILGRENAVKLTNFMDDSLKKKSSVNNI